MHRNSLERRAMCTVAVSKLSGSNAWLLSTFEYADSPRCISIVIPDVVPILIEFARNQSDEHSNSIKMGPFCFVKAILTVANDGLKTSNELEQFRSFPNDVCVKDSDDVQKNRSIQDVRVFIKSLSIN